MEQLIVPKYTTKLTCHAVGVVLLVAATALVGCSSGNPCPSGSSKTGDRCVTNTKPDSDNADSAATADPANFELTNSNVSDGAVDVDRAAALVLTFSAPIDATTANSLTVTIKQDDHILDVDVQVSGAELRVRPRSRMAMWQQHVLTVGSGLSSDVGLTLSSPVVISFVTNDGNWGTPIALESDETSGASEPAVTMNEHGQAMVVWTQASNILSNHFDAAASEWDGPLAVESTNTSANQPHVAIDPAGNAVAIWTQIQDANRNIFSSRSNAAGVWGATQSVESTEGTGVSEPRIALDAQGNGMAVWHRQEASVGGIWGNRFVQPGAWNTAGIIDSTSADTNHPRVAVDPQGNAVVVWSQYDGTRNSIWARRFTVPNTWNLPELIELDDLGDANNPQVAINSNGHIVVVWRQNDGTRNNIWANRFTPTSSWSGPTKLNTVESINSSSPQVAIDSEGNAVAVWEQEVGSVPGVWTSRSVSGSIWQTPKRLDIATTNNEAFEPQIALNSAGIATAVWLQFDGVKTYVQGARFSPLSGWSQPQDVGGLSTRTARSARIGMDNSGRAIVVWIQAGPGIPSLWSNRLD
jgi:hypothetical protein